MKENYTEIAIVLDRSGSMSTIAEDIKGGFDTFIADQAKLPGECRVSLVQFDDQYQPVYGSILAKDCPKLRLEPRGNTALLDAIGKTIVTLGEKLAAMPEANRPAKVIFVVMTDGQENASREFKTHTISEKIKEQTEKYNWQFVFMGANQDAILSAKEYSIPTNSALTFAANQMGVASGYASLSASVGSYRSGEINLMSFSPEDRKKQKDAGAE